MEKNNSGKMVAIVALVVAVVALSVGFAAFADDLYINGTATASASGNAFDAQTGTADLRYTGTPTCYETETPANTVSTANVGSFSSDGDTWGGISIPLGTSASSVTCEATVTNASSYIAYLTSLSSSGGLSCSSTGDNSAANIAAVCSSAAPFTTTMTVDIISSATDSITVNNVAATNSSKM